MKDDPPGPHRARLTEREHARRRALALVVFGVVMATLYMLPFWGDAARTVIANAGFLLSSGLAAVLCLVAASRRRTVTAAWRWFSAGALAWFLGQVVWACWDAIGHQPSYPSIADIGYTALGPLFFVGLVLLIRTNFRDVPVRDLVLDALIITVVAGTTIYEFVVEPLRRHTELNVAARITSVIWQVGTFSLLLLAVIALLGALDPVRRRAMALLLCGFVLFTIANLAYGHLALTGAYSSGHIVDLAWIEGFILVALAAVFAGMTPVAERVEDDQGLLRKIAAIRTVPVLLSVVGLASLSAYAGAVDRSEPFVTAGIICGGILLLIRLGTAALQAEQLDHRTRERDRLAGVVAASSAIAGTLDMESLLPRLATATAAAVGCARAEVYVFTEDGASIAATSFHGLTPIEQQHLSSITMLPVGSWPAEAQLLDFREPLVQVVGVDNLPGEVAQSRMAVGKRHVLLAPMLAHDRVIGAIHLWTPFSETPFLLADITAARAIGQQAGLAVHNARLLAQSRRHVMEQQALLRVSQAAVSRLDTQSVLTEIASATLGIAGAEGCAIEIWYPESDETQMLAQSYDPDKWNGPASQGKRYPLGDWQSTRYVLNHKTPLNLLCDDPRLTETEVSTFQRSGAKAILVVPLLLRDESIGVLTLFSGQPRLFSQDGVLLAQELAMHVALAIERARLHDALQERVDTDGLTGLLNHRAILERLDHELARCRRVDESVSVLMIDLDGFKAVNDQWGHLQGDEVLKDTARILRETFREVDSIGRYGGDEFLVVLPNTSLLEIDHARRRLHDRIEGSASNGITIHAQRICLSIGAATSPLDGITRADLVACADKRMYDAKEARRRQTDHHQGLR